MKGKNIKNESFPSIEVIDLFCGIGGLSFGMKSKGFNILAGYDLDATCRYAYETNNNAKFIYKDIKTVSPDEIRTAYGKGSIRVLAGCAPCQPFSSYAFKNKKKDPNKYDLLYILFQHFTRFLLQYIYNASDVQNEIQQSSDGTLDADEGQGHEQCCGYGCDSQQSRRDARYCYQAARHRKEQDGVGQHAPGFDAYRAETDESEEDGAEYDEKDDSEKCGDERRRIGENPVSAVADEGVP